MKVDPGWNKDSQRQFITTEILGLPKVTTLPFEHRDGTPYRIGTDYFGKTRQVKHPSPGALELSDNVEALRVKVWPRRRQDVNDLTNDRLNKRSRNERLSHTARNL